MLQKVNYLRINFIILALWGVLMTFLIPMWQTPDETPHLTMMGESIGVPELVNIMRTEMDMGARVITGNPDEKVDVKDWKSAMTQTPAYDAGDLLPKKISPSILRHLPAIMGMLVGIMLHLPAFWTMELAELFSLAFYLLICYLAIRIMPVKKEILMVFMSLPMTMQQASSINYDAILLPMSFLFIAYTMKLYCTEETITWKHIIAWILPLLLIAYIKIPYIVFGVLLFGMPTEKICLSFGSKIIDGEWIHRYRWMLRFAIVAILLVGIYLLRDNLLVFEVVTLLQEWKQTLRLFVSTARTWWQYLLVTTVGSFSWFEFSVPLWFEVLAYAMLLASPIYYLIRWDGKYPSIKQKVWLLLTFLLLTFFITISMVNHTITVTLFGEERDYGGYDLRSALYAIPYFGGVQGRYYLPFLPLLSLAIGKAKKEENKHVVIELAVTAFIAIAAITTVAVVYQRYWNG